MIQLAGVPTQAGQLIARAPFHILVGLVTVQSLTDLLSR